MTMIMTATDPQVQHTLDDLEPHLDALWTQYLDVLDEYTRAQAAIQEHLSKAFFSLTTANFKSPHGRLGQDYYDDRIAAITRVKFDDAERTGRGLLAGTGEPITPRVRIESSLAQNFEQAADKGEKKSATPGGAESHAQPPLGEDEKEEGAHLPTPAATPEPTQQNANLDSRTSHTADEEDSTPATDSSPADPSPPETAVAKSYDPIRMFGILVPLALRQAQRSFGKAVLEDECVSAAVNASKQMRSVEAEIRRVRKLIRKAERRGEST